MTKLAFSKLGLTKNTEVIEINFNGQVVEVKQYLPINDKAQIVATVLNYTINNGENRFPNPLQVETFKGLEVIEKYTNIVFTEKQKSDPARLYDLVRGSGLLDKVVQAIPENEYDNLTLYMHKAITAYYNYQNSIYGILDTISKDYSTMDLDATEIQKKLADPENMSLLRDVLAKLG